MSEKLKKNDKFIDTILEKEKDYKDIICIWSAIIVLIF